MDCCEKTFEGERSTVRSDEEKRKLLSHISRIVGQLNGIGKMIGEDRYCGDVLTQLAAVGKSVKSLAAVVLERHMNTCVAEHMQAGDVSDVPELVELFKKFQ